MVASPYSGLANCVPSCCQSALVSYIEKPFVREEKFFTQAVTVSSLYYDALQRTRQKKLMVGYLSFFLNMSLPASASKSSFVNFSGGVFSMLVRIIWR